MKRFIVRIGIFLSRLILSIRYRITCRGLDKIEAYLKETNKGVLVLPNHPTVIVDPLLVAVSLRSLTTLRPTVIEYFYYVPFFQWWLRLVDAIPIPNLTTGFNSIKRRRAEKALQEVGRGIKQKQAILIYPSGGTTQTGKEVIGGASGVAQLIQDNPNAGVVLVRITGLWGSCFSRASSGGKTVDSKKAIVRALITILKNALFFVPKRDVVLDFEIAPAELSSMTSKTEINRYLEDWYNRPFKHRQGNLAGAEPLSLVSYSAWKEDFLPIPSAFETEPSEEDVSKVPGDVSQKIIKRISELTKIAQDKIKPSQHLSVDLGMDSLDTAELVSFLETEFNIQGLNPEDLTTVARVLMLAAGQVVIEHEQKEKVFLPKNWESRQIERNRRFLAEGKTIPEVFLNACDSYAGEIACADSRLGIFTYRQLKMRALLLSQKIRQFEGDHIGVLLPSSMTAQLIILACQLAGKVPVMINWTVGGRHLDTVVEVSKIRHVLTSWVFLENLETVDLSRIEDMLIMLEDLRPEISIADKLKALIMSYVPSSMLLRQRAFSHLEQAENRNAVILFTSGTESMPKGVPLTHYNILSNQRAALEGITLYDSDKILSVLPPFHSFGFSITGLMPLLAGIRAVYYPNPTESKRLAQAISKWGITMVVSAPTFLKNILQAAEPSDLEQVRLIVSGAEKAPEDLFSLMRKLCPDAHFMEGYGITECAPVITVNIDGHRDEGVGQAISKVELLIVDQENYQNVLEVGQVGMILVRGPNVFLGYLGAAAKSPFVEICGKKWYVTGDLGRLDDKGNLILSGRLKRFIKIGGEMVSLVAVEDALLSKFSTEVVVDAKETEEEAGPILAVNALEKAGEKPQIVLFSRIHITVSDVNQALRDAGFSNLVKIDSVRQLATIPVTATGKVAYRELDKHMQTMAMV